MSILKQARQWFQKNIIEANTPQKTPLQIFTVNMTWEQQRDAVQTWLRNNVTEWPREPMCLGHVKNKYPLPLNMEWYQHLDNYAVWLMDGVKHKYLFTYERVWRDFFTAEQSAKINEIIKNHLHNK